MASFPPSPSSSLSLKPAFSSSSIQHFLTVDDSALLSHLPASSSLLTSSLPLSILSSLPPSSIRWYTKFHLKSILSMMGIKPRHMHRIIAGAYLSFTHLLTLKTSHPPSSSPILVPLLLGMTPFPPHSTLALPASLFLSILSSSLSLSKHCHPLLSPHLLRFSHSLITRQRCLIILLAGASGTGKSTLASLLADRLRIDRVIGTDGVRHIMRGKAGGEGGMQVMQVSTYRAWESMGEEGDVSLLGAAWGKEQEGVKEPLSHQQRVKLGYHQQSLLICRALHSLVLSLLSSRASAIIEGVHLVPSYLSHLLSLSSSSALLLPFLIYISNETKHRERLAVRASFSSPNPYLSHFSSIRIIQKHLLSSSASLIPSVDNTNVDRSVAAVHEMVVKGMEVGGGGGEEWVRAVEGMRREAWGGKAMQRVLKMKVEKRHLFERLREAERERREREEKEAEQTNDRREEQTAERDDHRETEESEMKDPFSSHKPYEDTTSSPPSLSPAPPAASSPKSDVVLLSSPSSSPSQPSSRQTSSLGGRFTRWSRTSSSSPSSPIVSPSLSTPPSFLSHLPAPFLPRLSSSPPLPSPEASLLFTVSDDDGGGGGGGRSESEEGGGSVVWSIGGSLVAPSVDEEEAEENEREEDVEEGEGEARMIEVIPESDGDRDAGEEGSSDSESGIRERMDTDEEDTNHNQLTDNSDRQSAKHRSEEQHVVNGFHPP